MKFMRLRVLLVSALLTSIVFCTFWLPVTQVPNSSSISGPDERVFFGVTFGGKTVDEAKLLVDKVKGYVNLLVVDSWDICARPDGNELTEICQYAVDAGMYVIVYFDFIFYNLSRSIGNVYNDTSWEAYGITPWHLPWLKDARENWDSTFLGVYLYDEPGGNQIETGYWGGNNVTRSGAPIRTFENVSDYSDAANRYVASLARSRSLQLLTNASMTDALDDRMPLFTSDFALYWFDYLAGYDVVFVELGWNNSRTQQIALCRGAANVQGKQWGAILTWTYTQPPYLTSSAELLQDMFTAYHAGAKYVVVFDYYPYPSSSVYGTLTEAHFSAMKQFWSYVHTYPQTAYKKASGETAFVLPKDSGWGMRRTQYVKEDKIWGLWPEDEKVKVIGENMNTLIEKYGLKLDIIYDDPTFDYAAKYIDVHFWNGTTVSG